VTYDCTQLAHRIPVDRCVKSSERGIKTHLLSYRTLDAFFRQGCNTQPSFAPSQRWCKFSGAPSTRLVCSHPHSSTTTSPPAEPSLRYCQPLALCNMAAVMSAKRPRALTNGIDSVGGVGHNGRVRLLPALYKCEEADRPRTNAHDSHLQTRTSDLRATTNRMQATKMSRMLLARTTR
jgi:hypothetical protein